MKKLLYIIPLGLATMAWPAKAICPLCVVAVGAGLGLSEYLGIDDTIAGTWIGGLLVALSAWTIVWFNKKGWSLGNKTLRNILIIIIYYAAIICPLFLQGFIGNLTNQLWGMDKLMLGIIIGSLIFWLADNWYLQLKAKNNGRAYFPFQKVVMPLGALLIISFIFYFLTK